MLGVVEDEDDEEEEEEEEFGLLFAGAEGLCGEDMLKPLFNSHTACRRSPLRCCCRSGRE